MSQPSAAGASEWVVRDALSLYDDQRIRIVRNSENRGLTHSLNIGLHEALGLLIARQDADDISNPERLRLQVDFLKVRAPLLEPRIIGRRLDAPPAVALVGRRA